MKAAVLRVNRPLEIEPATGNRSAASPCSAGRRAGGRPGPPGSAVAHRGHRCLPQRPALRGGALRHAHAGGAWPRGGRHHRGCGRVGRLRQTRRPRHLLPLRVLRALRAMHRRAHGALLPGRTDPRARRDTPAQRRQRGGDPVRQPRVLRRADAGTRELGGENRPRHPLRADGPHRLRCDRAAPWPSSVAAGLA